MNERLRVQIEADIKGLENSLKQADRLLKQHENNYKGVQSAISQNTQKAQQLEKSIHQLSNEYKKGNLSQTQYSKETDRLSAELREVNKETSDYQRELRRLDAEMDRVVNASRNLENATEQTGRATQNATQQVAKMGKETQANAVPAMTSLSQVVQDAPYGIRGVANNITQLTSQLGYLSASAGGTVGALKAMGSAMLGPAGILMGVSLVTSALVSYGDKIFDAVGATNRLTEATKEYLGEALSEISSLKMLVEIANDHTNSITTRRNAIKEINDKYGEYLGNLDLEKLKTNEVKTAIDNLTLSLLNQAKIKGLEDIISENTTKSAEKMLDLQLKQEEAWKQIGVELNKLDKTAYFGLLIDDSKSVLENVNAVSRATGGLEGANVRMLRAAVGAYKEVSGELEQLEKDSQRALEPYLKLQKGLKQQVLGIEVVPEFSQDAVEITGKAPKIPVQLDLDTQIAMQDNIDFLNDWKGLYADAGLNLYDALNMAAFESLINDSQDQMIEQSEAGLSEWLKQWEKTAKEQERFAKQMEAAVQGMIAGMISSLIDGKFELKNFVKSAASTLLSLWLTSSTGPLGGLFGGLFSGGGVASAGAYASGGIVSGNRTSGDTLIARVNSGEMILNKAQQGNLFKMLNNPSDTGESGPLEIVGHSRVSGEDLDIIFERYLRSSGRIS